MNKYTVRRPCILVAAVLVPATAWAHPGHGAGGGDWSVRHYLTEPDHLLGGLVVALVVAGVFLLRTHRTRSASASKAKDVH